MTVPVSPSFFRRNWLKGLLALMVGFPLLVLAVSYWWLLPNLPRYKDTVASVLSAATGYTITLEQIDGEWGGARPRIALEGVRLYEGNRPLLHFSRLEGRFGWRSLLTFEPRFHDLSVSAPAIAVRRAGNGMFHVGGLRIDPNSKDTSFSDWLLKQGEVKVEGATVAWIDEASGSPPLVLRNVAFNLQNLLRRHVFTLRAMPPANVATPVVIEGMLLGRSLSAKNEWHGTMNTGIDAVSLEALRPWLPAAWSGARGHGSIALTTEIDKGQLVSLETKLNLANLHFKLDDQHPPVNLERATGKFGWKQESGSQTLWGRRAVLKPAGEAASGPFDLAFKWGGEERSVVVSDVRLDALASLAGSLPLEPSWAERLRVSQPKGLIEELALRWRGEFSSPKAFSVQGKFAGLGWAANGQLPGTSNLSGTLRGDEENGVYTLTGAKAAIDLPTVFSDPRLLFDTLNIRGGWKKQLPRGYTLEIAEAALSNADLSAHVFGRYHWLGEGPGVADLSGRLDRATGPRVERYLPLVVNEDTHIWLRQGILRGDVSEATFQLKGDLSRFPFRHSGEGVFKITGAVKDAQIHFADDYPVIDHIDGELIFDGARMEIRSDKASIYGAQLDKVRAVIPDLGAKEELLNITGEAAGPAQEFIRFVNFSPVTDRIGGLTEEMSATGNLHLLMNIKVPLRHSRDTTLAGRLTFSGNTVFPGPDLPRLEQVGGQLEFTDIGVTTPQMTAKVLGGDANFSATTENGAVKVRGQGLLKATALDTWMGKEIASRLSGQTNWKGELTLGRDQTRVRLESALTGLESRLPAPMNKSASSAIPLLLEHQTINRNEDGFNLQYGRLASAVWTTQQTPAGHRLDRGELRFGDKAKLPAESGLQVSGYVRTFDLGGWVDLLPKGGEGEATHLSGINLTLARLDFLGRSFHDIAVSGKLKSNLLRASVKGREMEGNLTYRLASDTPARLSMQFRHFTLPEPVESRGGEAVALEPEGMPAMDVQVDDLTIGDRSMGRLEAFAHGIPKGLAIDQLNLIHKDSIVSMSGEWKDTGKGETRMKMNAEIRNAGQALERFGYGNALRRGTAQIQGEVTWQGSPADFAFGTLAGTLQMTAKSGQFTKVEPGAGKLLGVLSLQSIPRRLSLDFRDVFSEGFAFDQISSTMQLAKGTVYTNDFLMKGPSATVKMSGLAKLQDESVRLRVKVIPKLSEGVAVAGALLGGPVAGLGALVMQKALKDPIEEAISFEYLVDGGWDDPTVTKLAKPKPIQEQESDS